MQLVTCQQRLVNQTWIVSKSVPAFANMSVLPPIDMLTDDEGNGTSANKEPAEKPAPEEPNKPPPRTKGTAKATPKATPKAKGAAKTTKSNKKGNPPATPPAVPKAFPVDVGVTCVQPCLPKV
jgi:cytoskeletal protein RodZ